MFRRSCEFFQNEDGMQTLEVVMILIVASIIAFGIKEIVSQILVVAKSIIHVTIRS